MKIGFWGSGNMARVLGGAWSIAGHQIIFGSRDSAKSSGVAEEIGADATGGTNDEVAESCEVIVSSVRAVPSSFLASTSVLAGKVIIDLNNRDFPREYKPEEFLDSLAGAAQKDIPSAKVVKALNNQAMEVFNCDAAALREAGIQAFIAGDDDKELICLQLEMLLSHPVSLRLLVLRQDLENAVKVHTKMPNKGLQRMYSILR